MEQMKAMQAAGAGTGAGSNTWMRQFAGILSGPEPGYVKRCRCTVCGAPKKLTSVTAYVYCDYCGSLADFDLHRACEGSTLPGPEYRSLVNGVQPQLKAARAAGDAVLPGAKVVVYDECGRSLDVGSAALTCPGCGGSVTLAVGEANTPCPFCQSNVARIGVL